MRFSTYQTLKCFDQISSRVFIIINNFIPKHLQNSNTQQHTSHSFQSGTILQDSGATNIVYPKGPTFLLGLIGVRKTFESLSRGRRVLLFWLSLKLVNLLRFTVMSLIGDWVMCLCKKGRWWFMLRGNLKCMIRSTPIRI